MSKFLVPLLLPNLSYAVMESAPSGFVKIYVRSGFLKYLNSSGIETDIVLARPLDGFVIGDFATPVSNVDTVLSAFIKIQNSLNSINLVGDVTGSASYTDGALTINTVAPAISASQSIDVTDYDYHLVGVKNGVNKNFITRNHFIATSAKVYLNGIRLTPGVNYDYKEVAPNKIRFATAPLEEDLIIVDYKIINSQP